MSVARLLGVTLLASAVGAQTTGQANRPLIPLDQSAPPAGSDRPSPPSDALANMVKAFGLPMDIDVPVPPVAFVGHTGATNLVYELHMTNVSPLELHVSRIDVMAGAATLAAYEGDELNGILAALGAPGLTQKGSIGPGRRTIAFIWITVPEGAAVPTALSTRLTVSGYTVDRPVPVSTRRSVVIAAPLRGGTWVAGNAPSNASVHRRALMPVEGRLHNAQRFATDWLKLGPDGQRLNGDEKDNKAYYAYGSEVLAVADATVTGIRDGIPENVPGANSRAVPMTLDVLPGNFVILDLGNGSFALYAHLQPASLRVKTGDRVRRGQVLGLLGNSGNSTEPHLHFQVMDVNSALGSEGLPFLLESFEIVGPAAHGPKRNALPLGGGATQVNFP